MNSAGRETRTPTPLRAADFESAASTSSATPACASERHYTQEPALYQAVARRFSPPGGSAVHVADEHFVERAELGEGGFTAQHGVLVASGG